MQSASCSPGEFQFTLARGKNLSEVCTWGIGGPAKLFSEVHTEPALISCIRYCREHQLRFMILGKGSNCLFDDRGYDGCVILNRINNFHVEEEGSPGKFEFQVGGGYPFNLLGIHTSKKGLAGLEFASGIPGTVGGAVYMNAGADGQETSDVLQAVRFVDKNGERHEFVKERGELVYGYRHSPFQDMPELGSIVSATFQLQLCSQARDKQRDYLNRRKKTQPVNERSAGCVFRNPGKGCGSAGALIEAAGLKGFAVGGAKVSEMHANFVINSGHAQASHILSLVEFIKQRVLDRFGVHLVEEIRYIPYH